MAKISLAGFKDPVRRPRYIIWTGVGVLVFAMIMVVVLGITSTRWFCTEGCHKVQDDAIFAYQASTHSNVSCMSCHMPVNANPVIFLLHKMEALGELYLTVTDQFELPLNGESNYSLEMKEIQCTQCHNLANRKITPSTGIRIDHEAHSKVNAACPVCHNRIAHNENFDPTLKNPEKMGGEPSHKHPDYLKMTACFRCHGLEAEAAAPGRCSACHPSDFQLKPASHREAGFFPKGHAELAKEFKAEADKATKEFAGGESVDKSEVGALLEEQEKVGPGKSIGMELPRVETIFYCTTCHQEKFCSDCHGMEMPHTTAFKEPKSANDPAGHPALSKTQSKKCLMCHGDNAQTHFCDNCHHGKQSGKWTYDKSSDWVSAQHPKAVAAKGVKTCTSGCHQSSFCKDCHTSRRVYPSSHKSSTWVHPKAPGAITVSGKPAAPSAGHSLAAQKSIESCQVCHGSKGIAEQFCKSCHKVEMPHSAQFKETHVSGRKTKAVCQNCHDFKQVCSNCHHVGASLTRPWTALHGASVNKNGAATCVEKCHTKSDCQKCHTSRGVKPASHRGAKFVRDYSSTKAVHVQLYQKNGEVCTYCHKGNVADLPTSAFCKSCHKLDMPHKITQGEKQKFVHKDGFKSGTLKKPICTNCHQTQFCNACHHTESVTTEPWIRHHPKVVKKSGAEPCFDCHKETFCSNCHVNLAKRGLLN